MQGFPVNVQSRRLETAVTKWTMWDPISRADILLDNSAGGTDLVLEIGTVIGQVALGTPTSAPGGSNTGNGTLTGVAIHAGSGSAKVGVYAATCIAAAANSGTFQLVDPNGRLLGQVKVGTAVAGPDIDFTINDGSSDFVMGDSFAITVPAGSGNWKQVSATAVDGTQNAGGFLYARAFVVAGQVDDAAAVIREAAAIDTGYIWPSGASASQIAAWKAQLQTNCRIYTLAAV